MAANIRTEMRIPTRSAPHPPVNSAPQRNAVWCSTNNTFVPTLTQQPFQKKKPPPRPPPPKVSQLYSQTQKEKFKKQARPTELFTNFFGRKRNEHSSTTQLSSQLQGTILQPQNSSRTVCLIDFSPPGSPTFTTRSSSDGISIDSFGSDGNSNPSAFTSSGNTSQTESAFEDDFDFFGICKKTQNNPWQLNSVTDPFGPLEVTTHSTLKPLKHEGDAHCLAFKTNGYDNNQVLSNVQSLPTIIRAKPPKPPAPKILEKRVDQKINNFNTESNFLNDATIPFANALSLNITESWQNDSKDSPSPPMPTIPPPALPPECLTEVRDNLSISSDEPYGIALYDFPLTQIGDLPFKQGDVIKLLRKVNDDWIEGRIGNQQGIFPMNFVDIRVPLPGILESVVTAIYPFKGETAEDLTFSEGDKITVLSRISQDWLYGECGGRQGQFPVNYVNRVPHNVSLPH